MKITSKYIENHMTNIHTFDSFGRALVEPLLSGATEQLSEAGKEKVLVDAQFEIEAYEPNACVKIKTKIFGKWINMHIRAT